MNQFLHLFKDEDGNLKFNAKLYISYVDDNPFDSNKNIQPIKNIDYERTFNLKNFKNNLAEDTLLINGERFDIQIKIKE